MTDQALIVTIRGSRADEVERARVAVDRVLTEIGFPAAKPERHLHLVPSKPAEKAS